MSRQSLVLPAVAGVCVFFSVCARAEFRLGIIGCDTSHTVCFAKIANVDKDPRVAGFRVTCAYKWGSSDLKSSLDVYDKYISQIKEYGVEMKDSIADLLDACDGVLLETCDGRPHYEQAVEVFKSGKPCFIDKPVAADLVDTLRIVAAAEKYGAKWFCSSSLRFAENAEAARAGKLGKVRGVNLSTPMSLDPTQSRYYWYAIHGAEPLFTVMGPGCVEVRTVSTEQEDVLIGTWKDGRIGTMRAIPWFKGAGYGGDIYLADDRKPSVRLGGYPGYEPLLVSIVEFFKTGKAPVSTEETVEIYAFLTAAEKSRALGGAAVRIDAVIDEAALQAKSLR